MGFVELASKKPERTLAADKPMAIWSVFVDYSQIYSASREGAWSWSVSFVASLIISLVDSIYDCKTQQNATLTGQGEEGDIQLKVS